MGFSSSVPRRGNNSLVLRSKITDPDPLVRGTDPRIRIRTKIAPTYLTISLYMYSAPGGVAVPGPPLWCVAPPTYLTISLYMYSAPRGCGSTRPSSVVCGTPHLPDY
jgi:hypothetical protein